MSHVNAGGSTRQHHQRRGKRRGLKKSGGQAVKVGQIIVRQKGTVYAVGKGVDVGRDHTIFAMIDGVVAFTKKFGKSVINVK